MIKRVWDIYCYICGYKNKISTIGHTSEVDYCPKCEQPSPLVTHKQDVQVEEQNALTNDCSINRRITQPNT